MDAKSWQAAKEMLADVVDLPAADQRAYIERSCADPSLRAQLLGLLESPAPLSDVIARAAMLTPGSRLGPYEIVARIGAGGMGEVYKARDPRLGRDVAIKVLPVHAAGDPGAVARFTREARAVAALSHPHICGIYDVGEDAGRAYFVMELLDGETLHHRLAREPLKGVELLDAAIALTDALAAAHDSGIIHRDLKPSNIVITARGELKVLDFGLAKQLPALQLTQSYGEPLTAAGSGVGTLAYMSPEQVRGEEVDARTDLFSLGAVLYEMATGRPAFQGRTSGVVTDAILNVQPSLVTAVVPGLPPSLSFVIDKAFEKDLALRYQDARALRADLCRVRNDLLPADRSAPGRRRVASPRSAHRWRRKASVTLIGCVCVAGGMLLGRFLPAASVSAPPASFEVVKQSSQIAGSFALSPDGRHLAYVDRVGSGPRQIYVRSLETIGNRVLAGTEGAQYPFWSPDSQSIGFFALRALRRVGSAGGTPQTICPVNSPLGGTWSQFGVILYADVEGLYQVPAVGGTQSLALPISFVRWPQFLPDGRRYLYFDSGRGVDRGIRSGVLGSTTTRQILRTGFMGQYASPGYLLYVEEQGNLVARRFDLTTLQLNGEAVVLGDQIGVSYDNNFRNASFSVSSQGSLVFGTDSERLQLRWMHRLGGLGDLVGTPQLYQSLELSPDGTQAALGILQRNGQGDLWVHDIRRNTPTLLTSREKPFNYSPRWSPDGKHVAYSFTTVSNAAGIRQRRADGSGDEEVLAEESPRVKFVSDWWPSGNAILLRVQPSPSDRGNATLEGLSLLKDSPPPKPPLPADRLVMDARFSPGGQWIAFVSTETGEQEVSVQRVGGGRRIPISTGGGRFPTWRNDGLELFYIAPGGALMAVAFTPGRSPQVGTPAELFRLPTLDPQISPLLGNSPYSTRDGQRFLVRTFPPDRNRPLTWVGNWTAGMTQK